MGFRKLILALAVALPILSTAQVKDSDYWPTGGWRESTPEQQGIDSSVLSRLFTYVRDHPVNIHSVLIVRNGYVVLDASFFPYDGETVHDLASVTKSVTSTLIGAALQNGAIAGLDAKAIEFFPGSIANSAELRKGQMTIRDLLTMQSGFACEYQQNEQTLREMRHAEDWAKFIIKLPMKYPPGRHFEYCSSGFHLLSAILSKATGMSAATFAQKNLFEPLGIKNAIWPADPQGISFGWGDLHLHPQDAAKIGFLWLHGGIWDGKRLVAESWAQDAMKPLVKTARDSGYGYGFWSFIGSRAGEYEALGRGGQRITVIPRLNTVVVLTGSGFDPDAIGALLAPAVKSDRPLPENPSELQQLRAAISAARGAPPAGSNSALPRLAAEISGKTFVFDSNVYELTSFTLHFPGDTAASIDLAMGGRRESHPVSLNQRPVLSPGQFGLPVAIKGRWDSESMFVLDYDEIANNHAYQLRMNFKNGKAQVQMTAAGGRGSVMIQAHNASADGH